MDDMVSDDLQLESDTEVTGPSPWRRRAAVGAVALAATLGAAGWSVAQAAEEAPAEDRTEDRGHDGRGCNRDKARDASEVDTEVL